MNNAYEAYIKVCNVLNIKPKSKTAVTKAHQIWGVKGEGTLVIVPNVLVDYKQLFKLAIEFGKDQPLQTYIYEKLYELYTPKELSGKDDGLVKFLIIENNFTEDLYNDVAYQVEYMPKGKVVPSPLDAIVFWYVLRQAGKKLDFSSTYIRHFNLEPKRIGSWSSVPDSYVDVDGEPRLSDSSVQRDDYARLSVGSNLNFAPPATEAPLPLELTINGKLYRAVEL